jgi:hypothetical protein
MPGTRNVHLIGGTTKTLSQMLAGTSAEISCDAILWIPKLWSLASVRIISMHSNQDVT